MVGSILGVHHGGGHWGSRGAPLRKIEGRQKLPCGF